MTSFLQYCVNTLGYLRLMTVSDLIDIAILSFLFYKCIGIFQRTNAAKVAKALLLIIVAMWISYQFNLNAISFILNKAVELGLLALVVIFQPEIRRFLEQMGRTSLGKVFTPEEARNELDSAITQTVDAYMSLSKSKTGALMVFERSTKLGDIASTGVIIDASPSTFLIRNIFFEPAPLHDGALIISEGRLHAAGCFLPLSNNPTIIKDLGTRHRAAIGMSENCDAAVVVVSEETGIISLALEGKLYRNLDEMTLKGMLAELLGTHSAKQTVIEKLRSRRKEN